MPLYDDGKTHEVIVNIKKQTYSIEWKIYEETSFKINPNAKPFTHHIHGFITFLRLDAVHREKESLVFRDDVR
ncbi:hypothetical protein D3C87_2016490 [compost metagenome]